jgi:ribonuclease-3
VRDLSILEARIGHVFADRGLLERALTHVSTASRREESFQRLEFLGDRVLGLVVADMLYAAFPDASEGELSRRLAHLVRRETCAQIAAEWDAGPFVRLGRSEAQAAGPTKTAILSDVFESIIGAVFLDGGFAAATDLVKRAISPRMDDPGRPLRDAKTTLQEWAQARALATPSYVSVQRAGPDHAPRFTIAVQVDGFEPEHGQGGSKRVAEQAAAQAFLHREGVDVQADRGKP